jgi:Fe-S-cluster formation regulator IscX/YfhJ
MDNDANNNIFGEAAAAPAPAPQPQMSIKKSGGGDKWKLIAIIFIIATLVAGGLAAGIWLHYERKLSDAHDTIDSQQVQINDLQQRIADMEAADEEDEESSSLTIDEWGVMLHLPAGLETISYTIDGNTATFDTDDTFEAGCDGYIGQITRLSAPDTELAATPLNTTAIDGYYYYLVSFDGECDADDDTLDLLDEQTSLFEDAAQTIMSASDMYDEEDDSTNFTD